MKMQVCPYCIMFFFWCIFFEYIGVLFRVCLSRLHRPENWEVVRKMETHRLDFDRSFIQNHLMPGTLGFNIFTNFIQFRYRMGIERGNGQ